MSDNKRYYYLKLKDDFFDSDAMVVLESMQDGYKYSNILLKLYLRSLQKEGKLMFNEHIPYNATILSQVTRHSVGDVERAIKIFKDLGLIEILDNGAIYMLDIQNFIGKSSTEADRIRAYRARINAEKNGLKPPDTEDSYKCTYKCTPEIEIEKEIEIEREVEVEGEEKTSTPTLHERIIDSWNSLGLQGLRTIANQRKTLLGARLKEFGEESIFEAIEKIRDSDFLKGQNRRGWVITFDWLIKPNNYVKVLEGNYNDEEKQTSPKKKPKGQNFERREIKDDEISRKIQEDLLREYMEATGKL